MRRFHLSGLVIALPALAFASAGSGLPSRLASDLMTTADPMARYDWSAMSGSTPVRRIVEAKGEGISLDFELVEILWKPAVEAIHGLGINPALVDQIWARLPEGETKRMTVWLKTSSDVETLESALADAGWEERYGWDGVLLQPLNSDELALVEDAVADSGPEVREEQLCRWARLHPKVLLYPDGWVEMTWAPGILDVDTDLVDRPCPEDVPWPYSVLLDGSPDAMILLVADIQQNDAGEVPTLEDAGEEIFLTRRLNLLRSQQEACLGSRLADFALTVTEIDGGFALDVEARHPRELPTDDTRVAVEAALGIARLAVTYASPDLARELGRIRYRHDEAGHLSAEVVLSQISIDDALDTELRRIREIREINERLRELERQRVFRNYSTGR